MIVLAGTCGFVAGSSAGLGFAHVPSEASRHLATTGGQKVITMRIRESRTNEPAAGQLRAFRATAAVARRRRYAQKGPSRIKDVDSALEEGRDDLIRQWTADAWPIVRGELVFVRNVCQLDQQQFRQINRDSCELLKQTVLGIVDGQRQRASASHTVKARRVSSDGAMFLQESLAPVMRKDLSSGQWAHYRAELDKRVASRKRIGVAFLVDTVDRELFMTDHQRETLSEQIAAHWDESWYTCLEHSLHGKHFYPMELDPLVDPILSDTQKKVWYGLRRARMSWNFGGATKGFSDDQDPLSDELREVRDVGPAHPAPRGRAAGRGILP
jgi:hypothetical protein